MIGGGPAGAATAISLQSYGLRALVLEAERFPRHHVGESLVSLWSTFEALGVAGEMDATFQHKRGSCRVWGREPTLKWTVFDSEATERTYSLQVERSLFDTILLHRAEAMGTTVRQGYRVDAVLWEGDRAVGVRYRTPEGKLREARAPWVVDAGGRAGLIARRRRLRTVDPFYPDLSVYGYFAGARRFDGEYAGNLLIEAVPWGWFWFIPLHTGEISVGLVCDRSTRQVLQTAGLQRYFQEALASSTVIASMLAPATLVRGPMATSSSGYFSARYAGPGWMLAGDAGCFVDPMWATGVANALTDGVLAAAVIEGVQSGRLAEEDAVAYYDRELADRAGRTLALVKFVYRSNHLHEEHPFWRQRHADNGEPLPTTRILRRLSADPSLRYFLTAFRGMGIEDAILAPLDEAFDRTQERPPRVGLLLQDLDTWVPVLASHVALHRGLGFDGDRLVEGVVVDNNGVPFFTADPLTVAALESIDGKGTAREIVDWAANKAPRGGWLLGRSQLIAVLARGYEEGMLNARSAGPTSRRRGGRAREPEGRDRRTSGGGLPIRPGVSR